MLSVEVSETLFNLGRSSSGDLSLYVWTEKAFPYDLGLVPKKGIPQLHLAPWRVSSKKDFLLLCLYLEKVSSRFILCLAHMVLGMVALTGTWRDLAHKEECKMGKLCCQLLMLMSHLLVGTGRTLADFTYNKNYSTENWNWPDLWTKIIWDYLKLCWPTRGYYGIPKFVCVLN